MHRFQPPFHYAQARRIELDPAQVVVQRIHRFLQLDAGRLQRFQHRLEAAVDVDQLADLLVQRRQLRQHRACRQHRFRKSR